jgi:hypothetical protein
MMRPVSFKRWKVNNDAESTKTAYAAIAAGGADRCSCDHCRNFAMQRSAAYPAEVLELFESLGIAADREAEIYHLARVAPAKHLYSGWFHFVGEILRGGDHAVQISEKTWQPSLEPVSDGFSLGFTRNVTMVPKPLKDLPLVQIDFSTHLPWLLDTKEPE